MNPDIFRADVNFSDVLIVCRSDPGTQREIKSNINHIKPQPFLLCEGGKNNVCFSPVTASSRTSFPPGFRTRVISARVSKLWKVKLSARRQESTQLKVDAG